VRTALEERITRGLESMNHARELGNPIRAHTGCTGDPHYQLDFVSGPPITDFSNTSYSGEGRLINWANG
jgi:hypothetical protein